MKKLVFFLALVAVLVAASNAVQRSRLVTVSAEQEARPYQDSHGDEPNEETSMIHERMLRMNAHDYGKYDPTPTLSKPRFKLIPN